MPRLVSTYGGLPMRPHSRNLSILAALLLLLSACTELTTSRDTETQRTATSDLENFTAEPNFYGLSDIESAIADGEVGRATSDAVVTLFFRPNGKLVKGTELLPLVKDNKRARSKPLNSTASTKKFFQKHGVSVYFTDFTTFKRVMNQLAEDKRVSLSDYTPLKEKYVIAQEAQGIKAYTFFPYVDESTAELTTNQNASVVLLKQDGCYQSQARSSNPPLVKPTHVSSIVDWQLEDDQLIYPQQLNACLASCAAGYAAALTGCAFIPFPGSIICAGFASLALGTCQTVCYQSNR